MRVWGWNLLFSPKKISQLSCYVQHDRLSSLPDDLIHRILAYISVKDAVKTSVLSSRWRYVWTSMPYLHFTPCDLFSSYQFVIDVLTHRNNQTGLCSLSLIGVHDLGKTFYEGCLNNAFCNYNIQQLTLEVCFCHGVATFPISLINSKSLKHLTLRGKYRVPSANLELLALTTLHLSYVTLYNDNTDNKCNNGLFFKCENLKNLTLNKCIRKGSYGFRICHPRLSSLTIIHNRGMLFKGRRPLHISRDTLRSLERLDICIVEPEMAEANKMFDMFHHLQGVKFLRLNLELVLLLSWSMAKLSPLVLPSPFTNLKRLMIDPVYVYTRDQPRTLSARIKNYFLEASSDVSFTVILHKESVRQEVQVEMQRPQKIRHHNGRWTAKMKSCFKL